jgi:kinetochore protein Spc7/SPC105
MTYQREIELVFDISSFGGAKASSSRIDLWYIAANRDRDPLPTSPEKEFFVQCIRDHVRGTAQTQTKIRDMLGVISGAWKKANYVAANVRLLNCTFPTKVVRTSDSSIAIRSSLLLVPLETKVEVTLALHGQHTPGGLQVSIAPQAQVIYGEHFKIDKVTEYLTTRIGTSVVTKEERADTESWSDVVVELHERLLARGRK